MKHNYLRLFSFFLLLLVSSVVFSQVAKTQVVQLQATANADGTITLNWPAESYLGNFVVYHRDFIHNNAQWTGPDATLSGSTSSWTDATLSKGKDREYLVSKLKTGQTEALGYIYAGNSVPANPNHGAMILLIDSSYIKALSKDISQLKNDLIASGWFPKVIYAGRKELASTVKNRIKSYVDAANIRPKSLYIIGHVPVPYSGNFSSSGDRPPPDGHVEGVGNHTGAWPADLYYGDLEGFWSDQTVSCTTGGDSRNHNIPGDGKFDQSVIDNPIELEVARIDMYAMDIFSKNDTQLVSEYLNRVHDFKLGKNQFRRRALIDNNFTGLNLASTGYHNLPCFVGIDSVNDALDYLTEQTNGSYLWSYGCGAGSYSSCNGIGSSNDFVSNKGKFKNAFTFLAGSFFGDWDSKNNLLRSTLAGGSLACCWGGIPKWYLHHMGLGINIGYGAKITQNNTNDYFNGAFNGSWNGVFIALMGDPTLTMLSVAPCKNVKATSQNGTVKLTWNKAVGNIDGYIVYRLDTLNQNYKEVGWWCQNKNSRTTDTFFTDLCNWSSGNYLYAVRSYKLEKTGSGTYENLAMASLGAVQHTNSMATLNYMDIKCYPNPSSGKFSVMGLKPNCNFNLIITNVLGEKIQSKNGLTNENGEIEIHLKDHEQQLLNVSILQGSQLYNSKVTIANP